MNCVKPLPQVKRKSVVHETEGRNDIVSEIEQPRFEKLAMRQANENPRDRRPKRRRKGRNALSLQAEVRVWGQSLQLTEGRGETISWIVLVMLHQ